MSISIIADLLTVSPVLNCYSLPETKKKRTDSMNYPKKKEKMYVT